MKDLQYVDIHEMYLIFEVKVIHVQIYMYVQTEPVLSQLDQLLPIRPHD